MVSENGRKNLFKYFCIFSHIRKNYIYHNVIGGLFPEQINDWNLKIINSFVINWVETKGIKEALEKKGVTNSGLLPNIRNYSTIIKKTIYEKAPFRYCIFSRISKEKGVSDAILAINHVNETHKNIVATLDIYGVLEENYKDEFEKLVNTYSAFVTYFGAVDSNKAPEILNQYHALLFPTKWIGEGFPGTIIDAMFAGLPVIASDWNYNSELIKNGTNGFIYPNELTKTLEETIEYSILHHDLFNSMKSHCTRIANQFDAKKHIKNVADFIYFGLNHNNWISYLKEDEQ